MSEHTLGLWKPTNSWSRYGTDEIDDHEMMNYNSQVMARAPFTENEESDIPGEVVEEQSVATAHGRTPEEVKANAHLISTAPNLKKRLEDDADAWDQVAAYAEECGETDGPINQIIAIAELQAEKARAAVAKAEGRKP